MFNFEILYAINPVKMTNRFLLALVLIIAVIFSLSYNGISPNGYSGAPVSGELSCTICHYIGLMDFEGFKGINRLIRQNQFLKYDIVNTAGYIVFLKICYR